MADIKSISIEIKERAKNIASNIWSVELSDSKVKAGGQIEVGVILQSFRGRKKRYQFSLDIPQTVGPGKYSLVVSGGYDYRKFVRTAEPYKYMPRDFDSLVEALNNLLAIKRNKLYCLLLLPDDGVFVERAQLPDLPATKAIVMSDAKRTLKTQPYQHWLEQSLSVDTVVFNKRVMQITVEK